MTYIGRNRNDKALDCLKQLNGLAPNTMEVMKILASLYARTGSTTAKDEAAKLFKQVGGGGKVAGGAKRGGDADPSSLSLADYGAAARRH